ncbi:MAG: TonB-dependent receptor [Calditrichaeota bacterium]|nr:TonB-dependent receptor [Calditrichota bacterium]
MAKQTRHLLSCHFWRIFGILFIPLMLQGATQSGARIQGRVVDEHQQPMIGANIYLEGTILGASTNENGFFFIDNVPPGQFTLVVSMMGYQLFKRTIQVTAGQSLDVGTIQLRPAPIQAAPIVVTASRTEEVLQEATTSITVMQEREFRLRNNITLNQALQYISGINLNGGQVNIRGATGYTRGVGSRVLLLLDGLPLLTGDTREINFDVVPLFMIERVEVLKGAGSALYGSGAMGGVINIITRGIQNTPTFFTRWYAGMHSEPSYRQWQWSDKSRFLNGQLVGFQKRWGTLGLSFIGTRDQDDSYRQNDWRLRHTGSVKLQWDISPFQQFILHGNLMEQKRGNFLFWKDLQHALQPPEEQRDDWVHSRRGYLGTSYRLIPGKDQVFQLKALWFSNWFEDNIGEQNNGNRSQSNQVYGELQYSVKKGIHFLTAGISTNYGWVNANLFGRRQATEAAFYLQNEMRWNPSWKVTLGIRGDYFDVDQLNAQFQISPRLGIHYSPGGSTHLRASLGWGFRAPSLAEAFTTTSVSGFQVIPNYQLKPETNFSAEVGIRQQFGFVDLDLAVFNSNYRHLIEPRFLTSGQIQFQNVIRARITGIEGNLSGKLFQNRLIFNYGYTYVHARDLTRNDYLNFRPRHLFYASQTLHLGTILIGLDYRYIAKYDRIDPRLELLVKDVDQYVPAHVLDGRISAILVTGKFPIRFTFHVDNILQYYYTDLVGALAPLRKYVFSLEMGFH